MLQLLPCSSFQSSQKMSNVWKGKDPRIRRHHSKERKDQGQKGKQRRHCAWYAAAKDYEGENSRECCQWPSAHSGEKRRCHSERGRSISNSYITPLFGQNGAKSGFEMCFGPGTLGAGAKTRLESRIKEFTPHCVCRPR